MSKLEELFSDKKIDETPETQDTPDMAEEVVEGKPLHYQALDYKTDNDNWIECTHGYSGDDYLWHIAPRRVKKQWKMGNDLVITHLAYVLSQMIPKTVDVKIWAPFPEWDVKEITFRAVDLKSCWAFDEKTLPTIVSMLLKKGNELV